MVVNNGLAERQNKIKLKQDSSSQIINQYEEAPIFSVEATGENISYQWQYKDKDSTRWLNVPNGIFPGLQLSNIPTTLNDAQFRCKISNNIGTVYSNPATLTVKQPTSAPTIVTQPKDTDEIEPTTDADIFNDVYAQVVIGLNSGGGGGGGSDIYTTTDLNDTSSNAVLSVATTKQFVNDTISAIVPTAKYIYVNETELTPNSDFEISIPINHGLESLEVITHTLQKMDDGYFYPFVCDTAYINKNNIVLTLNYDATIPAGDIMVIVLK